MRDADVEAVEALATLTFEDLDRRRGVPPPPRSRVTGGQVRMRRVLTTDPAGCWVADGPDGGLAGAALAIVREGVWGLSMFVVRPGLQSAGLGGALLRRALDHGAGTRGGIILSSPDPRALRVYRRAGFALHPVVSAAGVPGGMAEAPGVRAFTAADHAMAAAVDRRARGAAHGGDLDAIAEAGGELLALPGRGYAGHRDGKLIVLAAADEEAAAAPPAHGARPHAGRDRGRHQLDDRRAGLGDRRGAGGGARAARRSRRGRASAARPGRSTRTCRPAPICRVRR